MYGKHFRLENGQLLMKNQTTKIPPMLTKPYKSGTLCTTK